MLATANQVESRPTNSTDPCGASVKAHPQINPSEPRTHAASTTPRIQEGLNRTKPLQAPVLQGKEIASPEGRAHQTDLPFPAGTTPREAGKALQEVHLMEDMAPPEADGARPVAMAPPEADGARPVATDPPEAATLYFPILSGIRTVGEAPVVARQEVAHQTEMAMTTGTP